MVNAFILLCFPERSLGKQEPTVDVDLKHLVQNSLIIAPMDLSVPILPKHVNRHQEYVLIRKPLNGF